jgi:hypothetical protein
MRFWAFRNGKSNWSFGISRVSTVMLAGDGDEILDGGVKKKIASERETVRQSAS